MMHSKRIWSEPAVVATPEELAEKLTHHRAGERGEPWSVEQQGYAEVLRQGRELHSLRVKGDAMNELHMRIIKADGSRGGTFCGLQESQDWQWTAYDRACTCLDCYGRFLRSTPKKRKAR